MLKFGLRFFFLLISGLLGTDGNNCMRDEILPCREDLEIFLSHPPFYYAQSNETLNELCRKQRDLVKCIEENAKACLSPEDQQIFDMMTNGQLDFMTEFCSSNSRLRTSYMKHASCIQNATEGFGKCFEEQRISEEKVENEVISDSSDLVAKTCCIFYQNIRCSTDVTELRCGKRAAALAEEMLTKLAGNDISKKCQRYHDKCLSCGFFPKPSIYVILFAFCLKLIFSVN